MQLRRASTHRTRSSVASLLALLLQSTLQFSLALLTVSTPIQLCAQTAPPPPKSPYTLHVYTRRLEIPTLVLPSRRSPLPSADTQTFSISLDSGPRFHPTHVRLEGDDPIALSMLLDVSGNESDLLSALNRSMPAWVAASFGPQDHFSIYAVDCSLMQTDMYQTANPTTIGRDLNIAITSPLTHGTKTRGACGNSIRLWDSMSTVMQQMAQLPGRRVLLVCSDGYDGKSVLKWSAIKALATRNDITIFALTSRDPVPMQADQSLNSLIAKSGGLYLHGDPGALPKTLLNFIDLLHGRYILNFPMPANFTSGSHLIDVTVNKSDALIRPSSITVPLPDPSIANDPTTIPSNNPDAPVMGKRPASVTPHR